jgi:hypothetical protein
MVISSGRPPGPPGAGGGPLAPPTFTQLQAGQKLIYDLLDILSKKHGYKMDSKSFSMK